MGHGYQRRDLEIIDYHLWSLPGIRRPLRGPRPERLGARRYLSCVGAAQTFGCYAPRPYPARLAEALGVEALNLGVAGAGPGFFLTRAGFLSAVNDGYAAVVQVMSGRSVANHLFESNGLEMLTRRGDGRRMGAAPMYRDLLERGPRELVERTVRETRQRWVDECSALLQAIEVPTVLLWFSTRVPRYNPTYASVESLFGAFPQLVDAEMVAQVRPHCAAYVECVTRQGLPQKLYSRFDGKRVSVQMRSDLGGGTRAVNSYYPSPEMHAAAADRLAREPVLLDRRTT